MLRRLLIGLMSAFAVRAHDPITTRLTWNREVSRIVFAKCAGCHRPGGAAFSLLTYQDARPWARAISEEVLERRMPPWGGVKGFGEIRDEKALTQTELDTIAQWVDGGAPEGDPKDWRPAPPLGPRKPEAAKKLVTIDGEYTVPRAITLAGLALEAVPDGGSMRITAELPDGRIEPLVWLYRYDAKYGHAFLLRRPLRLPRGAVIRGIAKGTRIALLGR